MNFISPASEETISIVNAVKKAIQQSMTTPGLSVSKIDLELKNLLEKGADGEIESKLIKVGLKGSYQKQEIQTISMSLIPVPQKTARFGLEDIDEELSEAISIIRKTIEEAASTQPAYQLEKAQITLQFQVTKEGKISILLGAGGKSEETHTVTLTINPQ